MSTPSYKPSKINMFWTITVDCMYHLSVLFSTAALKQFCTQFFRSGREKVGQRGEVKPRHFARGKIRYAASGLGESAFSLEERTGVQEAWEQLRRAARLSKGVPPRAISQFMTGGAGEGAAPAVAGGERMQPQ